jgi:hypothetical protein
MSKVVIQGHASGTGDFTIAAPNSNNNRTLTLPDTDGTLVTGDDITINGITSNYTSGTALNVDSNGIVTKPNQPLFSGYQSGSNTGATGGSTDYLIICNGSYVNNGSHYNTSTGVFTCPVDGIYRVHAYAMSITASANGVFYATRLRLYVNGAGAGNYAYNYGDGYRHVSGNWALTCSANDTLGVMSNDSLGGYNWIIIELVG